MGIQVHAVDEVREQRKAQEEYWEKRKQEESGPVAKRKCTPIEYLQLFGEAPRVDQVQVMTMKDLTAADARELLAAGVSKRQILQMYGVETPGGPYYKQLSELLKEPVKSADIGADRQESEPKLTREQLNRFEDLQPRPATEEELREIFEEPPISEAARRVIESGEIKIATAEVATPAPTIDLDAWELVDYASRQRITEPYLHLSARGDGVIRNTDLKPGSRVQFRIDSQGRRIAVIPVEEGQLLFSEKQKRSTQRFSGGNLSRTLQAKGIELPANFRLEWNEAAGAWIGELVVKSEGVA